VGIVKYTWDFGDGNHYVGIYANVTHIYEKVGNYSVNLTVQDAAGYSNITSSFIIVKDLTPPSTPKGLVVTPLKSGDALEIEWNPLPDSDLDHYELYYRETNGTYTKIAELGEGVTTYTHEGLERGESYRYYLIAVDTSGNPSSPSLEVEGIPDVDTDDDGIFNIKDYDDDDDGLSDEKEIEKNSDPLNPDSDGDKHIDGEDAFPTDPREWKDTDYDGYGDDHADAFPKDPKEWKDSDGDGIGDNSDFLPINNFLFFLIIIIIVIVAIIGTIMMVRRRGRGEAYPFSPEQEQSKAPGTPSQPSSGQTPSQPSSEPSPSKPRSKSLPPPPRSRTSPPLKKK
ncbi:MAG: PKD domain-containing protein, partial [Thermoplasmata archaeon]